MQDHLRCAICGDAGLAYVSVQPPKSLSNHVWQFWRCPCCHFIWRDSSSHVSFAQERARYETHDNSRTPSYEAYFRSVVEWCQKELPKGARVLDFGAGKEAVLAQLLRENGFQAEAYDLHFIPDESVWGQRYHAVIAVEVFEHLADPRAQFQRLQNILHPNGQVLLVTHRTEEVSDFANWWYARDPTHIGFHCEASLARLNDGDGVWRFPRPNWAVFGSKGARSEKVQNCEGVHLTARKV